MSTTFSFQMSEEKRAMESCIDCQHGLPFVKEGKAYQRDTSLYACDDPTCQDKVCRRHLHSLYTRGDYCATCAEKHEGDHYA